MSGRSADSERGDRSRTAADVLPDTEATLSSEKIAEIIRQLDESQGVVPTPPPPQGSSAEDRAKDHQAVLDEIDRLREELGRHPPPRPRPEPPGAPASVSTPPPPVTEASPDPTPQLVYGVSPYMEERLVIASESITSFGEEVRDMGERWQRLRGRADMLERELGNATREVQFMGSSSPDRSEGVGTPAPAPTLLAAPTPSSILLPVRPPAGAPRPPYVGFTAARYNATVDGLKSRRRRLTFWTLLLATGISAALVTLAVLAHEAMPALWLAVLPAIWLLPVPFFALSFFGTQRVLRRNHLNVAGDP